MSTLQVPMGERLTEVNVPVPQGSIEYLNSVRMFGVIDVPVRKGLVPIQPYVTGLVLNTFNPVDCNRSFHGA